MYRLTGIQVTGLSKEGFNINSTPDCRVWGKAADANTFSCILRSKIASGGDASGCFILLQVLADGEGIQS